MYKREGAVDEALCQFDVPARDWEIRNHFSEGYLGR